MEKDLQQQYRQRIKDLRLIDDEFMTRFFDGYIEGTALLVRTILGKADLKIDNVRTQRTLKNLQGRSVRLDILARDSTGRIYNIEVQRADEGAGVKRACLHSALLISDACKQGCEPVDYPEIYVVFITENDVLKKGCPLYRIERMLAESGNEDGKGNEVDDGEHIIYVNGEIRDKKNGFESTYARLFLQ